MHKTENTIQFPTRPIGKSKTWLDVAQSRIPKPMSEKKKTVIQEIFTQPQKK